MYARRHITALKKEHKDIRKKLHSKWYKNNIISLERDSLVRQINIVREKKDWLGSTVRSIEAELEVLKAEREALKLEVENLRRHCNDAATLEESLNTVTEHRYEPSEESIQQRVDLALESERPEGYTKAIEVSAAFKLKMNELRGQCEDATALNEDRDRLLLEAKRQARCTKAMKVEREALNLEAEHFQGQDAAALNEVKRQAKHTKAIEEERDALKLEAEHLRGQCKDTGVLKEKLNIARVQRPKLRKGRIALVVTVIILALCFSVRLFWTLRHPLNNYGTLFASPCKTSSYSNLISATTVPSRIIIA
jgi:chromosome segregation ATPase